jgi:hypothetical protein
MWIEEGLAGFDCSFFLSLQSQNKYRLMDKAIAIQ